MRKILSCLIAVSAVGGAMLVAENTAKADVVVVAGTPEHERRGPLVGDVHPGAQLEGNIGSGFSDTYNVGFGARLGFTTDMGIYLGGNVEHFVGSNAINNPHTTFVGGEVGLKLFPTYRFELRPYGFMGAEIPSQGKGEFAFHPGVVAAYHFGQAFIDLDGRFFATPGPTTFALLGGAGLSF